MQKDEKKLIHRAQNYDEIALAEIYDRYSPALYRYAMRLLGEQKIAEDCVSETFLRYLKAIRNGKGPEEHLQAYLYRIAHNWITDQYRRNPIEMVELQDYTPDNSIDLEREVQKRIRSQKTRRALSNLTEDQRQVIILKYMEGWENGEIAGVIGKSIGAVKALIHRSIIALQKELVQQEQDHEKRQ